MNKKVPITKLDKFDMAKKIANFPKQFKAGFESAKTVKLPKKVKNVLICGMGGSVLPGIILKMREHASLHINQNYDLPSFIDESYLVICISYSGNTQETLSSFHQALDRKLLIACITSGGELARLCKKRNIPLALVPKGYPSRIALGFQFAALTKILIDCDIIKNNLKEILNLEKGIDISSLKKQGEKLANELKNKIPLIYSSEFNKDLAYVWKTNFNENSKIPAFFNYFPELNHNEFAGFKSKKYNNFHLIILKDINDKPEIIKRMNLTSKMLKNDEIKSSFVKVGTQNSLQGIFSNIILSYWTSYYLALENKIDPTPVELIEEFKKELEK